MNMILIGNGGHSKVVKDILHAMDHSLIAILDDKFELEFIKDGMIYGPLSSIYRLHAPDVKVLITIGNNFIRKKLSDSLNLPKEQYGTIVHPTALVSATVRLGSGTVVMPHAVINADAKIGEHCIINTGSIIEHECHIGSYVHVSPNATLTGNVRVGTGSHIGASATVIPGKQIGNWATIGAGSTVIHDIPDHSTAVGSPTRLVSEMPI
ncbi:acetyltransferase [Sediminibacillus massiliensis]|uniref:acetyltransferase n=1 Tax=Sediminibacillus massiliensis TaxID=1926277 RepID=UPI0015C39A36|nr:acetyltransferase [Sediminibacillus massiliensis]